MVKTIDFLKEHMSSAVFLLALICLFVASSPGYHMAIWCVGLCSLMFFTYLEKEVRLELSAVGVALLIFAFILFLNAIYFNPIYHAVGIYLPIGLILGFISVSLCPKWMIKNGFKVFIVVMMIIALWGLFQTFTGLGFLYEITPRAEALFVTPNSFATAINLVLIPLICYFLLGHGKKKVFFIILMFFSALIASQSKGSYLALFMSIVFFCILVGVENLVLYKKRFFKVLLGFFSVIVFFKIYGLINNSISSLDRISALVEKGDTSRLDLYEVAFRGFSENFWNGIGYFNFGYYFEGNKLEGTVKGSTYFVHNDYLQIAAELGIIGVLSFLALIVIFYWKIFQLRKYLIKKENLPLLMISVAIMSMFVHALVDFPFYIPILFVVFGMYIGLVNRQCINLGSKCWRLPFSSEELPKEISGVRLGITKKLIIMLCVGWLALPAAAELSAKYGLNQLKHLNAQGGIFWHAIARELQPRDANYYWLEGVIWRDLGTIERNEEYISKSDLLFSQGVEVNPFEVKNLLSRITLHRDYSDLFENPENEKILLAWMDQAKRLRPESDSVQIEYIRTLAHVGQRKQATEHALKFLIKYPEEVKAKQLFKEVSGE